MSINEKKSSIANEKKHSESMRKGNKTARISGQNPECSDGPLIHNE